jgi:predicted dehydrogenase
VRVALVGVGDAAGHHARALSALANEAPASVSLRALVARDAGRERLFREKLNLSGDVQAFRSLEALLAADECDAVILATPDGVHFEQALACLRAKKAVLVEKPLTLTLAEAEQLREAAVTNDRALVVGYHLRHHPAHELLARLVGPSERECEGAVGALRSLFLRWAWPDPAVSGWRARGASATHFSLSALGTHAIDAALQLAGDGDVVKDVAYLLAPTTGIDHAAEVSLRFASGLLAHVSVAVTHRASSRILVVGERGELEASDTLGARGEGTVAFRPHVRGAVARPLAFVPESPYLRQLRAFVRATEQGFAEHPALLENVRILEQIRPSPSPFPLLSSSKSD